MRFKKLRIYEHSMQLVKEVYELSSNLPKEEIYNLCSQMTRAAISIPSNIAEGSGKNSDADFSRFISISHGSCCELFCQIEIIKELYPWTSAICDGLLDKIDKLSQELRNFRTMLKSKKINNDKSITNAASVASKRTAKLSCASEAGIA